MPKIYAVQVRMTRDQHERLKANAARRGFATLASYLRYVGLDHDFTLLDKVTAIHRALLQAQEKKRRRATAHNPPRFLEDGP